MRFVLFVGAFLIPLGCGTQQRVPERQVSHQDQLRLVAASILDGLTTNDGAAWHAAVATPSESIMFSKASQKAYVKGRSDKVERFHRLLTHRLPHIRRDAETANVRLRSLVITRQSSETNVVGDLEILRVTNLFTDGVVSYSMTLMLAHTGKRYVLLGIPRFRWFRERCSRLLTHLTTLFQASGDADNAQRLKANRADIVGSCESSYLGASKFNACALVAQDVQALAACSRFVAPGEAAPLSWWLAAPVL